MQRAFSTNTGPTFQSFATCGASALTIYQQSIFSLAGSRVSPLVTAANGTVPTTIATYGRSFIESFANLNQNGFWEKTYQGYYQLTMDDCSEAFSETWPRSGIASNGIAYRLLPLAPLTDVIGYSLWPTPKVSDALGSGQPKRYKTKGRWNLRDAVAARQGSGPLNPAWVEWLMGFPLDWTDLED